MDAHPLIGARMAEKTGFGRQISDAILHHHERLDGSGYPYGTSSEQISFYGQIIAVADVYDAMTNDRPYRRALTREDALGYLKSPSFNQRIVRTLEELKG